MEYHNIDLQMERRGFRRFVSSWLLRDEVLDRTYLVDTGPSVSWPILREAVERLGGGRVDGVFLTHVHIDHAGAAALAVQEYGTPLFVSERGVPHLLDPSALWAGSVKTLGETAFFYGKPEVVPADALCTMDRLPEGFLSVPTPGHAAHHQSFAYDDPDRGRVLFAGEAAGVFLEGEERAPYLRPATPPRFFPEVTVNSMDRLLALKGTSICYAHFGWSGDAERMLTLAKEQLRLWRGVVCDLLDGGVSPSDEEAFFQELVKRDSLLGAWRTMEPDIREREREFIGNSISGFLGAYGEEKKREG